MSCVSAAGFAWLFCESWRWWRLRRYAAARPAVAGTDSFFVAGRDTLYFAYTRPSAPPCPAHPNLTQPNITQHFTIQAAPPHPTPLHPAPPHPTPSTSTQHNTIYFNPPHPTLPTPSHPQPWCCTGVVRSLQACNVAFAKTHKTASTTLAMILVRYARRHDKKVNWLKFCMVV